MMQALFVPRRLLAWLMAAAALSAAGPLKLVGQVQAGEGAVVDVRTVRFSSVRAPGGGDSWTEVTVELGITPAADGGVYARWADNVRVGLSLAIRRRDGEFAFYRASAEAVALEAGRASIRFYLPPEVARREQLGSIEAHAWLVELAVRGQPVPAAPGHMSSILAGNTEALRSFKDRVARSSTLNDGVLVPQALSPFAAAYAGDTPAFVRR